ncbi:MAG: DUF6611 family protein [Actinomycetota bacterium]
MADSAITLPRFAALERALMRAIGRLEGKHRWGYSQTVAIGSSSNIYQSLILFPPGTDASKRRALIAYRYWPVVGIGFALATLVALSFFVSLAAACYIGVAVYGLGALIGAASTRRERAASLRIAVLTVHAGGQERAFGNVDAMHSALAVLARIDRRLAFGALADAEYDLDCAALYRALEPLRGELAEELTAGLRASSRRD